MKSPDAVEPPHQALEINGLKHEFVLIRGATFTMGRNSSVLAAALGGTSSEVDEGPERQVTITSHFYLGKFKVTTTQYCDFLNNIDDPDKHIVLNDFARVVLENGAYRPREGLEECAIGSVPWTGSVAFCEWLSEKSGRVVRLPTEAEWELAARGPEDRMYPWGDEELSLDDWVGDTQDSDKYPHPWSCDPVDAFPKNATPQGVHRMADYVGEWVSDFYGVSYLPDDVIDPLGPSEDQLPVKSRSPLIAEHIGVSHVLRRSLSNARATQREPGFAVLDAGIYGFRIVVEPSTQTSK